MKTFDCLCEDCGIRLGEATFPDEQSEQQCIERTIRGYLCQTCSNRRQEAGVNEVPTIETVIRDLALITELKNQMEIQIQRLNEKLEELNNP